MMNRTVYRWFVPLGLALLTACGGGSGGGSGTEGRAPLVAPADARTAATQDRPVTVDDVLVITIVGETTPTTQYPVSAAGYIQFPYLDLVKVDGLTPTQIKELIEKRLKEEGYFVDPQVLVTANYQEQYVHVLGAVARPGAIPFRGEGKMDILDAISFAGGTTRLAKDKVEHTHNGVRKVYSIEELKRRRPEDRVLVEPGDIIEVKESFF